MDWIALLVMFGLILGAAQLLTNALEYFAERLHISSGATGSILAAVATALPEASIPIIAIVYGVSDKHVNEQISVGAILGAPLMLGTLAIFLMSFFAMLKRGIKTKATPELSGYKRDLDFFLVAFLLAGAAMYMPTSFLYLKILISLILILIYMFYLYQTLKVSKHLVVSGHNVIADEEFYLARLGFKKTIPVIVFQFVLGLILLCLSAKGLIHYLAAVALQLNINPLLLSLLIIPFATELPEKINSILWIRKKKDTLAFGNITGAMVFQGTLLPAIGILLTPWQHTKTIELGIYITLAAAFWMRMMASKKGISLLALLINGLFYGLYLYLV